MAQVAVPEEREASLLEQVFKTIDSHGPDPAAPSAQQVTPAPPTDHPNPRSPACRQPQPPTLKPETANLKPHS